MYHYLQFRPDKKEKWHFLSEEQIQNCSKPPAYISVLKVDQDVEALEEAGEDALDVAKYKGPMYFDLDGTGEIDAVLDASRDLLVKLRNQLGVPREFIRCWLSGGKGVHFTIDERVFGVKRATKQLPYIYHEIAKQVEVPYLDMGVYSAGRGRLWRCPGVARPKTGTYKVPVTLDELETLDAETYETLCSQPRPEMEAEVPDEKVSIAKAEVAFKKAKQAASRRVRAIKNAKVIPAEELRKLAEMPGCIQKLLSEGDSEDSNWNQAAMQVAAWVAARYTRDEEDEYMRDVVEPFVKNVESSSRPSEKERLKHVKDQLNRAFSGKTQFAVGPLIRTLGEPCHACPLCRGDLEIDSPKPSNSVDDLEFFDKSTKIIATPKGYNLSRGDNPPRPMAAFSFWPTTLVKRYEETSPGVYEDRGVTKMLGILSTPTEKRYNFAIPTDAWASTSAMRKTINVAQAGVFCGDSELQMIYQSINNEVIYDGSELRDGITTMAEVGYCGMILEKQRAKGGRIRFIPHYVEEEDAITPTRTGSMQSKFRFQPPTRDQGDLSPRLLEEEYPFLDDTDLEEALNGLLNMNEPAAIAKAAGWMAACFLKEHLHQLYGQFPLLNLWGNASAGKSMSAYVLCRICGMDYMDQTQAVNMEVATAQPLRTFVSSSTTVPRLIEEFNESGIRNKGLYTDTLGALKAAYNGASIQRGGRDGMQVTRVKSPIVYISEQRPTKPSVRNRTVEVMLTASNREKEGRPEAFKKAFTGRHHLNRAAKALLDTALRMSLDDVRELFELNQHMIPDSLDERPRYNFRACLLGLELLGRAMERFEVNIGDSITKLKEALESDISGNYRKLEQSLRRSEVDMVINDLENMASEPDEREGIKPGVDYFRNGNWLSLDISKCFNRYRRFSRSVGQPVVFQRVEQLAELLQGEMYFDRIESDPEHPTQKRFVLDVSKMEKKGIATSHFKDTES